MAGERYFVQQLLPHLYVVAQEAPEDGSPCSDCHVYLLVGQSVVLAVDAGGGNLWPFVVATAQRYDFVDVPISHVLVTHGHRDHVGGLSQFEGQGALTVSSEYTAGHLESDEDADVIFSEGDVLQFGELEVQTVATPGHTPGSTSYLVRLDGATCLFAGDLIQIDGGLGWCGSEGFSQEQVLTSLHTLRAMPTVNLLLAGHGWTDSPLQLLDRAIRLGETGCWIPWTDKRPKLP